MRSQCRRGGFSYELERSFIGVDPRASPVARESLTCGRHRTSKSAKRRSCSIQMIIDPAIRPTDMPCPARENPESVRNVLVKEMSADLTAIERHARIGLQPRRTLRFPLPPAAIPTRTREDAGANRTQIARSWSRRKLEHTRRAARIDWQCEKHIFTKRSHPAILAEHDPVHPMGLRRAVRPLHIDAGAKLGYSSLFC